MGAQQRKQNNNDEDNNQSIIMLAAEVKICAQPTNSVFVNETSSNFEPEMPDIAVITKCVTSTGIRNTDGVLGEFVG